MPRLFSYLMTDDTGFAPNPFYEKLTLATCKPGIRRTKKEGDWIAGFASKSLVHKTKARINHQGLIYLMWVGKVMPLSQYFSDAEFQNKKPPPEINGHKNLPCDYGDNIYFHDALGNFQQHPNGNHTKDHIKHDTFGKNVLIADKFYYFGKNCPIPENGWKSMGVRIPIGHPTFYGYENDDIAIKNICNFLHSKNYFEGIHGNPCLWTEKENQSTHQCRSSC